MASNQLVIVGNFNTIHPLAGCRYTGLVSEKEDLSLQTGYQDEEGTYFIYNLFTLTVVAKTNHLREYLLC